MRQFHTASHHSRGSLSPLSTRRLGLTLAEVGGGLLMLLGALLALAEGVQAYSVQQLLQDAARRGCRAAYAPGATNQSVAQTVDEFLIGHGIPAATSTILLNQQPGDVARSDLTDEVTVCVTLPARQVLLVPGLRNLWADFTATSSLALQ